MNINYKLTLSEYQEAVNFHYKSGKRPLFIAVFLGMATFMMLAGTDFSNTQQVINNILITFFALAFYLLFTRMVTAYQAKKVYNKSPILSHEVSLRISGKGIRHDKKAEGNTIPWNHFSKWKKNDKFYLIYTNPHQFNVIPTRAMSDAQKEELDAYLEKYL
jgi:hypothetical protein